MTGSGLTQTWTTTGLTTLTGTATTAGTNHSVAGMYTPAIASTTPAQTVTTDVGDCASNATTCSGLGTLTVVFAHPVVNPTIHFAGLGGTNELGVIFHATLTLTGTVPATTTTLSLLSGVNTKITSAAAGPMVTATNDMTSPVCDATPTPAACGSVQVMRTVSALTFTVGAVATGVSTTPLGAGSADEYSVLATVDQDYGDAPTSYDQGNAARAVLSDIHLGERAVTADNSTVLNETTSPKAGAMANGDGNSDDGVELKSLAVLATTYKATVKPQGATTTTPWEVCGWVDFNQNGIFDGAEGRCKTGTGNQEKELQWSGLTGLVTGTTYARFRIGYNSGQTESPTGPSDSGEVEDYAVNIVPVAAPTAVPDSPTMLQDVTVTVDPLANDNADPLTSLDPETVRLLDPTTDTYGTTVVIAGQGTYTANTTTGRVTFDPLPALTGGATPVWYRVEDKFNQIATSTITPMVTPVIPAPVNDSFSTPFNTPSTVDVLANDLPGEPSSPLVPSSVALLDPTTSTHVLSVSIPDEGSYSVNSTTGEVTFTPEPVFRGPATPITYRVADDNGTKATAALTMTVGAPPSPSASDDSVTTPQGIAVTLRTLLNDAQSTLGAALTPASVMLEDPADSTFKSSVTIPTQGTWTVNTTTGDVTFTPLPTFIGSATAITYRVADTNGATAEAVEGVTVSAVIPTANPDSTTTPYETPVTLPVVDNDDAGDIDVALVPSSVQLRDPDDGDWKSTVTLTGVGTYAVQLDDSVRFTPVQGYTGTSSLTYRIADGNGTYAQSTVSVTVSDPPAPTADPDTATTAQGVAVSLQPLTNDSSDPAAPLDPTSVALLDGATPVASLSVPGEGTYTVNPTTGVVTYTPLPTFHGSATPVNYQVADEAGQLASSTISVEVTAVTPTASPDSATTPYAHAVNVPLLTNDAEGASTAPLVAGSVQLQDTTDSSWQTSVALPGVGTFTVAADGSVDFTPAAGYSGTTTDLPYRVADANGTYAESTVRVTVGAAPQANPDSGTTPQGVPTTVGLLGNDSPGSGAALVPAAVMLLDTADSTYTTSLTIPGEGTYTVDPVLGEVTFTPVRTYHGTATSITYEVADSDGNVATSTLSIIVSEVTPAAKPDIDFTSYETPVTVPLLANDEAGDPDVGLVPASVKLFDPADITYTSSVTLTGVGTYVVQPADGSVVFTPDQGFTGMTAQVSYTVEDENGTITTSTVEVGVSNPPAPVADADTATTPQGIPVTLYPLANDTSDPAAPLDPTSVRILDPGDSTNKTTVTVTGEGTYSVDGATGTVLFTPALSFHGTATALTYRVPDEAGQIATSTLTVTVDAITPTASADSATTPYLHAVNVPLVDNDTEGAWTAPLVPGSVQLQDPGDSGWKTSLTVPGMGTYVMQPDDSVTFTPQAGYSGTTTALPYRVADTNGTYALSTVTITVGSPPTASPDTATTPQGLTVLILPLGNDTPGTSAVFPELSLRLEDPATPGLWLLTLSIPGEGSYDVGPTGEVFFWPEPTFHGTATSIPYQVTDSDGNVAVSSITVTVTPVTPVATPDTTTTPYETVVNLPLLTNDAPGNGAVPLIPTSVELKDPTDNTWKSVVTITNLGTYTVQPNGSVNFLPAQAYTGTTTSLPYRVADANGTFAQSTLQVTVENPPAPTAADDQATTLQGTPVTLHTLDNDTSDPAAPLAPASVKLLDPATSAYASSVTIPAEGTYVVDPTTGDVTFTPLKPFHGTARQVMYQVKDEAGQIATAAIKVVVTAVTPTATPDSATTPYAHAVTVPLVSDDSAGDPSIPLVPSSLTLRDPSGGVWKTTVTVAGVGTYTANPDGTVGFVPALGYTGTTAALPYRVADSNGTYAQSTVTITVQTAPHATPDSATTLQGQPVTVTPLTNDTPGGTATLVPASVLLRDASDSTYKSTVTIAGEGTYTVDPVTHNVRFAPVLTFSGPAAAVAYRVTDSDGNSASSTITITVTPVIPVALPDNVSTPYAHSVNIPLLANDHAGDPVVPLMPGSVRLKNPTTGVWATTVTVAGVGTSVAQPDGSVTFTPAIGYVGSAAALSYRVADSNGTVTASTFSVVVGAPPVAAPDTTTTLQNQPVTLTSLANDHPGTNATLVPASVRVIDPGTGLPQPVIMVPNQGTYAVDSSTGAITFTPVPWFNGSASAITYQVSDSDGNTATSWLSVHVTAVVPDVVADSATTPFRTPVTIPVLANDAAGDATAPLVTASVVLEDPTDGSWTTTATVPAQGTFAVLPDGQVLFTPAADYEGIVDTVMYRVADANDTTRTATIHVVVGDAPVAAPDSATTLQGHPVTLPLLANDQPGTDGALVPGTTQLLDPVDSTYRRSVTITGEGRWTIDPTTGDVTFTPLSGFVGHSTPVAYEVTDSFGNTASSTARITVAEVLPTASGDTATTPFRTPITVAVLSNDRAGRADTPLDPTTVELKDPATDTWGTTVTIVDVGSWAVETDGSVTFTPVATYQGVTAPLTYQVADVNTTYAQSTIVVTVAAPYGATSDPDSASSSGTHPVTLNPLLNDMPSNGATWIPSSVCIVPTSARTIAGTDLGSCPKTALVAGVGTWVVNLDGTMTFTPMAGFTGTATIGYLVTDTNGVQVANTALVTVTTLPNTGGPVLFVGVLGMLFLLAGGVVLLIARRREEHQA